VTKRNKDLPDFYTGVKYTEVKRKIGVGARHRFSRLILVYVSWA